MCGISGIVADSVERYSDSLLAMQNSLLHRGPDEQGRYYFKNCALAHTRLSIVDLMSGQQPLLTPEETATVFNGEIYGYKDIRYSLGYNFKTRSDTELIPALYDLYGKDCCKHIPGMFSFALWDEKKQVLLCGRDRFGEKPFYYSQTKNGCFVFASELHAILASKMVDEEINLEAISQFLALRYVPETMTIYKNIHVLKPGHSLVFENGIVKTFAYWKMPHEVSAVSSLEEANEEFSFLMKQAVRRCLIADVDVGLLLSGGLDSTTIAAVASKEAKLHAFAFGMPGERNELPYARDAASKYNLPLVEIQEDSIDFPQELLRISKVYGEPFGDNSAIPTYVLCKHVREHIKVALSGDGGDELLAGYTYWYKPLVESNLGGRMAGNWSAFAEQHWKQIRIFSDEEISTLELPAVKRVKLSSVKGNISDALQMDLLGFLPSDVLRKIDRASMAHGLELRCPFLDKDLAEFLITLPWQFKIDKQADKIVMRSAYQMQWPESIRARKKQGFGAPVYRWLERSDSMPLYSHYLGSKQRKIRELIRDEVLDCHAARFSQKAWLLLVLSIWLEHSPFKLPSKEL